METSTTPPFRAALNDPGVPYLGEDERKMYISFDGVTVNRYDGPDFSAMTVDEINDHIARMDKK